MEGRITVHSSFKWVKEERRGRKKLSPIKVEIIGESEENCEMKFEARIKGEIKEIQ